VEIRDAAKRRTMWSVRQGAKRCNISVSCTMRASNMLFAGAQGAINGPC
jgi:hypothetical protein